MKRAKKKNKRETMRLGWKQDAAGESSGRKSFLGRGEGIVWDGQENFRLRIGSNKRKRKRRCPWRRSLQSLGNSIAGSFLRFWPGRRGLCGSRQPVKIILKYGKQPLGGMGQRSVGRPDQIGGVGAGFLRDGDADQIRIKAGNVLVQVGDAGIFPQELDQGRKLVEKAFLRRWASCPLTSGQRGRRPAPPPVF